jgi:molybdate transport system ATP-binding protein
VSLTLSATHRERDVSVELSLHAGETLALLGPNGAGKSTVLGILAGLVRPDTGRAALDGEVLFDLPRTWTPPHRRGVALLAQDALLFPHLTVRHNVEFGPRSTGADRADARERAETWMHRTGTASFADRHPGSLSGGQAQRVAIARALAAQPRLLLLDEPLAALDVAVAAEVRGMLAQVLGDRTTVLVTHDVLDAYLLADRVAVLHEGRVVEHGETRRVLERPRHPFTADLSGLTLLTGGRTATGLVTADGLRLHGTATEHIPVGAAVAAVIRPSAVSIAAPASAGHAPASAARDGGNRIPSRVTALEPHADLVRVRTTTLAALVPPAAVADAALRIGSPVELVVPAEDVVIHPR